MPSQLWASSNSDQWQQGFGHLDNGRNCHKYIENGSLGPELGMMVHVVGKVYNDSSQYSNFDKHG